MGWEKMDPGPAGGGEQFLPENVKELNCLETFRTDTEHGTQKAQTLYDESIQFGAVDPAMMKNQIAYLRKCRKQWYLDRHNIMIIDCRDEKGTNPVHMQMTTQQADAQRVYIKKKM